MKQLIAVLGWLGMLLVGAAVVLRFAKPELAPWYQGLAIAGLVVMVLYTLTQWRDVARSFQGRNVKYGSIAASSVALVLAILTGINWISSRENKRWDLTSAGQFSLSDQTKKLLSQLQKPVTIKVFYQNNADEYRDKLTEYSYISKQVTAQYVDVDRNNLEAQSAGISAVPTFVMEYDGRTEKATAADEQSLTNALKKLIEGKAKKIYFLQGHGEHDPTGSDASGYSAVTEALKSDNFETDKLTLAQTGKIPDDATVLVIAGPKGDLLPPELDLIRGFLKRGGKLMVLLDPPDKAPGPDVPGLIALAREWGASVGNDLIVDVSGLGRLIGTGPSVPIAMPVQHPITNNFSMMTAFLQARSVTPIQGGTDGHTAQTVLQTSPQSWAETDLKSAFAGGEVKEDLDKGDKAGPVSLAVAVSAPATDAAAGAAADAPKPDSRVVIAGDSDFASNRGVGIQGNREIFLNMANWLAQQEELIAIRPRNADDRPLSMSEDQRARVFWFTMLIVPVLLLGNGIRVWWRRR